MSIRFERVSKAFGSKRVLNDVSFEIAKGEIVFILGRSGVGKSVTLKHLVGLLRPDSGQIYVNGIEITSMNEAQLSDIRKQCGMVFQHPALLDSLTIFENVAFGLRSRKMSESAIRERAIDTLKWVYLNENVLDLYPPEISYGMQKRASLARTLAPGPEYLLFDEPTTGLDPISTTAVNDLIFDLSRRLKVTSVVVSHDMGCALKIADRILVLDQGKILSYATVEETKRSTEPLIRDFLREALANREDEAER